MKRTAKIIILLLIIILTTSLYACNKKVYTISFVSFGDEISTINHKGMGSIELPEPTKEGYDFLGWFFDEDIWQNPLTDVYFAEKKIDKNYTVYAKWRVLEYVTVTFETYSADLAPILVVKGKSFSLPVPTREGFSFLCWCSNENLNSVVDNKTLLKKDTKVYAKWLSNTPLAQTFTIKVISVGYDEQQYTATYGSKLVIPKIRRIGYKLDNFYIDDKYSKKYDLEMLVTTSFTLYAAWYNVEEVFTVSFNTNGGEYIPSVLANYDELISSPNTTLDGYIFEGWYVDNSFKKLFNFSNNGIVADTVLYAKWHKEVPEEEDNDTYTINFVNNGGEGISATNATVGEEPYLHVPVFGDIRFLGWYFDKLLTVPYSYNVNNKENITLYAKWDYQIEDDDYVLSESTVGNGLKIVSYNGSSTKVTLPDSINGRNIIEIGEQAFINNSTVVTVVLNNFITHIGQEAFANCTSLVEFSPCDKIMYIGERAFFNGKIAWFSFSEQLQEIARLAFSESEIKTINIQGNAVIGERAFESCVKLTTVTMNGVKTIYQNAFNGCDLLTQVNIAACETIGNSSFANCISLPSISLANCINISASAFEGCTNLASVSMASVETIEACAFKGTALAQLSLPSIIQIGEEAFAECSNLTSVELGQYLQSPNEDIDIFKHSSKVNITIHEDNAIFTSNSGSLLNKESTKLVIAGGADNLFYQIPNGIIEIGVFAFSSCHKIKHLNIPASVSNVNMSLAFIEDLEEITLDTESVSYKLINGNLYDNNDVLIRYMPKAIAVEFTISEQTTAIFSGAFAFCSYLQIVTLNDTSNIVNFGAFYECFSLVEVRNAEHITVYEDYCFQGCYNFTTITFGEEITEIGDDSFTGSSVPKENIPVI